MAGNSGLIPDALLRRHSPPRSFGSAMLARTPSLLMVRRVRQMTQAGSDEIREMALGSRTLHRSLVCCAAMHVATGHMKDIGRTLTLARHVLLGRIAQEISWEGRGDALVIAAAAMALQGAAVHVLSPSGAAAARLHSRAADTLQRLGIASAHLPDDAESDAKWSAYGSSIVFASAVRVAQDCLRDQVILAGAASGLRGSVSRLARRGGAERAMLPEYRVAFVDDADFVMLDKFHPVRFAQDPEEELGKLYAAQAFQILSTLHRDSHYIIDVTTGRIMLTDKGQAKLETFAALFSGQWTDSAWREKTILASLTIRDLFMPGVDYTVQKGQVRLARATPTAGQLPSIPDLISVKEKVGSTPASIHLWDTRRLLTSYARIGGLGVDLARHKGELKKNYGTPVKTAGRMPPGSPPQLYPDRRLLLKALSDERASLPDTAWWAPTQKDLEGLPPAILDRDVIVGLRIFCDLPPVQRVVQLGAAPRAWEIRLSSHYPDAAITAYASCGDGLFANLPPNEPALLALGRRRSIRSYRTAQNAASAAAAAERQAQLRSDQFFDRVLSFAGAAP